MSNPSGNPLGPKEPEKPPALPDAWAGAIDVVSAEPGDAVPSKQKSAVESLRLAALRAAGVVPHPALPLGEQPRFWLRRADQVGIAGLMVIAMAFLALHWLGMRKGGQSPVEITRLPESEYTYRIDINDATWIEWAQFDGIGEMLARRIVADREERGPFRDVDDLLRVPGIGRVRLKAMRRHLVGGSLGGTDEPGRGR